MQRAGACQQRLRHPQKVMHALCLFVDVIVCDVSYLGEGENSQNAIIYNI